MAHLNFDDTLGVADAIAAAGAPSAATHYPRFPRALAAIFTELHGSQEERLSFSQDRAVNRAHLAQRVARTRSQEERQSAENALAEFDAFTKRRLADYAQRDADGNAKLETDGRCAITINEFLKDIVGQGKRLRDMPLARPHVLPAGVAATIEAKRDELAGNAERRADIGNRPALPGDLKAAMSRAVSMEAEKGRPRFDARTRGQDASKFSDHLIVSIHQGQSLSVGRGGVPFLVWLLRDQIEARLHAMVDEADLTGAMSDAEQAAALAALDAERLAIEREEEALIRMAEAQGMTIARRADMDPRAALMVEVRGE